MCVPNSLYGSPADLAVHSQVLRFFEDPLLCSLPALQRLHTALQATSAVSLKEAIMDAFRAIAWEESGAGETEEGEEGVGLQLLGGWVYKVQLSRSMGGREWGHLYDLVTLRASLAAEDELTSTFLAVRLPWLHPSLLHALPRLGYDSSSRRHPFLLERRRHSFSDDHRRSTTFRAVGRPHRVGFESHHAGN